MTREEMNAIRWALGVSEDKVGPACMNVPVPETLDMTDQFREVYVQGYRHAIADVRAFLDARVLEWWTEEQ